MKDAQDFIDHNSLILIAEEDLCTQLYASKDRKCYFLIEIECEGGILYSIKSLRKDPAKQLYSQMIAKRDGF